LITATFHQERSITTQSSQLSLRLLTFITGIFCYVSDSVKERFDSLIFEAYVLNLHPSP
jgi:hypothetical protein